MRDSGSRAVRTPASSSFVTCPGAGGVQAWQPRRTSAAARASSRPAGRDHRCARARMSRRPSRPRGEIAPSKLAIITTFAYWYVSMQGEREQPERVGRCLAAHLRTLARTSLRDLGQLAPAIVVVAACAKHPEPIVPGEPVRVDGSSTVYLVSKAVAEQTTRQGAATVFVNESGTTSGCRKLCSGQIDVSGRRGRSKRPRSTRAARPGSRSSSCRSDTTG